MGGLYVYDIAQYQYYLAKIWMNDVATSLRRHSK